MSKVDDLLDGGGQQVRPKRRNWFLLVLIGVLGVGLVAAFAAAVFYGKSALDALDMIERDPSLAPTPGATRPEPVPTKEGETNSSVNIVLMGSDTRGDERGRSDVLQVLHVPGDRSGSFLMSIPRDTWVSIPGRGVAKINAAYAWGGAGLTIETLEQLLEVPMDHTVLIDFEGFIEVIDALGGVTVVNRNASSSGGFDFPEGEIELSSGEMALQYVRERKNLPNGDFSRGERQRDVVMAVVRKLASAGTLTDPGKFRDAITSIGPNFTVDEALTNDVIIAMAMSFGVNATNIRSFQFPTAGTGTSGDGQSIVLVDEARLELLKEALRADDLQSYYDHQR